MPRSSSCGSRAARSSSIFDDHARMETTPGPRPLSRRPSIDGLPGKLGRHPQSIKRWDGSRTKPTDWDGLRRDPELWVPDGECLVHLYGRGRSRRGPSFRLSLAYLASSELIMNYIARLGADTPTPTESSMSSDEDYFGNSMSMDEHGLYIPAPARLSPADAFRYHLTTRNLFACIFGKPLVGTSLGQALIDLLDRMNVLHPSGQDNMTVVLAYIDHIGYMDFRECPDHALAVLNFAERFEIKDLWMDGFVHCTGMNDRLVDIVEFENVSGVTQALIMRMRLEMDIRLERAAHSLNTFLEDDLSAPYLGLGHGAMVHLDHFRSFLHSYYVGKHGYWPPGRCGASNVTFHKSIFRSMYFEFRDLYEFLLDPEETTTSREQKCAAEALCVSRTVTAFDRRNDYDPLPNQSPLVPQFISCLKRQRSANPLEFLKFKTPFGSRRSKIEGRMAAVIALSAATNSENLTIVRSPLVQEYIRFEEACAWQTDEKFSAAEGRKIRWILVYAALQVLVSVNRAPSDVRDTDGVSYPLCLMTPATLPWEMGVRAQPCMGTGNETKIERKSDKDSLIPQAGGTAASRSSPKVIQPLAGSLDANHARSVRSVPPLQPSLSDILRQGYTDVFNPAETDSDTSSSRLSPGSGWSDQSASSSDDGLPSVENISLGRCTADWTNGEYGKKLGKPKSLSFLRTRV